MYAGKSELLGTFKFLATLYLCTVASRRGKVPHLRCMPMTCLEQCVISHEFVPVSDGRLSFGGSLIRPEATGYGLIYFLEEMIKGNGDELKVRQELRSFMC